MLLLRRNMVKIWGAVRVWKLLKRHPMLLKISANNSVHAAVTTDDSSNSSSESSSSTDNSSDSEYEELFEEGEADYGSDTHEEYKAFRAERRTVERRKRKESAPKQEHVKLDKVTSFETDPDDVDDKGEGEVQQKVKARRRKTKRRVIFDKTCKKIVRETGLIFASVRDFREAVTKYVVQQKVFIEEYVNEPTRVRVKCKKVYCPWLLVASYDSRTKDFVVKNYNPVHKYDPTNRNKLCNSKFLAKRFNERIKEQLNIRIFKFQEFIRKKLGLYVGRTVYRRVRNIVLNEIMDDHKLEYGRILDYSDEFLRSNPGSTCVVKLSDETFEGRKKMFVGFYICFDAMKKSYLAGCRPCIGLDGCFLKGICRGQLLVAVGDGTNLTIITNMQKGLENAITNLLPNTEHRMCARHILANWSKKWRGIERRNCFWRCTRSIYEWELKKNLDEIKKLGNKIVDELLYYNIERWSMMYFNTFCKCDSVDNNMAKYFNAWILAAR
ncbi:uncharacterized protein [Nicotiana tomentosiformis]|uniref:uncharacterized protein n=1 Tax=Nicotiana tomentosiformis TaxID=4098 RepID=UPI00388C9376